MRQVLPPTLLSEALAYTLVPDMHLRQHVPRHRVQHLSGVPLDFYLHSSHEEL
jgi:hypothetical protein